MKRKTRKAIRKQVTKVIRKHGPEIATGIATGLLSSLITLVGAEKAAGADENAPAKKKGGKGKVGSAAMHNIAGALSRIPAVKETIQMLSDAGGGAKKKAKKQEKEPSPEE